MIPAVAAIAAGALLAVITILLVWFRRLAGRRAARNRPEYNGDNNSPIQVWRSNCQKSIRWSQGRRGKEV